VEIFNCLCFYSLRHYTYEGLHDAVKIGVILNAKYNYISFGKHLNEMVTKLHKIKEFINARKNVF
jgi:hypothetical protein